MQLFTFYRILLIDTQCTLEFHVHNFSQALQKKTKESKVYIGNVSNRKPLKKFLIIRKIRV